MDEEKSFVIDRKFCFKVAIVYFLSVLFANFMAQRLCLPIVFPVLHTESLVRWKKFIETKDSLVIALTVFCFLVPSVICINYACSFLYIKDKNILAKRIVNVPLRFSLFGILGWILHFVIEVIFAVYAKVFFKINISFLLISSVVFLSLECIFSFVVSFFVIETVNRKNVLPRIFPNGNISKLPGIKKLSLRGIFLIFFIATSIFPVMYLMSSFISVQINNGIEVDMKTISTLVKLLGCGFLSTYVFMRLFTEPLKKLTKATKKIESGDYSEKVKIISNDEMGLLGDTFNDMTQSLQEKEFMKDAFGKVVDPCVRDYLLQGNTSLGGENAEVTVMFCDIRNFTAMSESMKPKDVVSLLNRYFIAMEKCITANNGIINKYIGDAIMAIFGSPIQSENCMTHKHKNNHEKNHAVASYKASLEMKRALAELNKSFAEKNIPPFDFGIGLHSGEVLAGNIGTENRMEYTIIGDTVNTASRIGALCKTYKTDLLLSESTLKKIEQTDSELKLSLKFVGESEIRGRVESVKLYTW